MGFFVAVVIVLLVLIYFMFVVLRSIVAEVNQKVNGYFLKHLEEYEKNLIDDVRWMSIEEAIEAYNSLKDEPLSVLIKRRELPLLKIVKERYFNKKD